MNSPMSIDGDTVKLSLHVQPGASRTEWAGHYGERALKLRLAAPPVDGRANRACIRFLAKSFGVPASGVRIIRGEASRDKLIAIAPVDPRRWAEFTAQWGSA